MKSPSVNVIIYELEQTHQCLVGLRDNHLSGQAAVVRAIVQKRIEGVERAIKIARNEP